MRGRRSAPSPTAVANQLEAIFPAVSKMYGGAVKRPKPKKKIIATVAFTTEMGVREVKKQLMWAIERHGLLDVQVDKIHAQAVPGVRLKATTGHVVVDRWWKGARKG